MQDYWDRRNAKVREEGDKIGAALRAEAKATSDVRKLARMVKSCQKEARAYAKMASSSERRNLQTWADRHAYTADIYSGYARAIQNKIDRLQSASAPIV